MDLEIVSDFVIYEDMDFDARFPDIVQCMDQTLLLSFCRSKFRSSAVIHGDIEQNIVLMRSEDGGKRWRQEAVLGQDEPRHLTCLENWDILRWNFPVRFYRLTRQPVPENAQVISAYGFYRVHEPGLIISVSEDNGYTWTPPRQIKIEDAEERCVGTWGRIVALTKERLLWPVYMNQDGQDRCYLLESNDRAKTWHIKSKIGEAPDINLNEPFVLKVNTKKLAAFMRSEPLREYDKKGAFLYTAFSDDGGHSWSETERTDIDAGSTPFFALRLTSGSVLLAYGFRREPFGLRLRLLDSQCKNINQSQEIVVNQNGVCWDLGYPSAVQLPKGEIPVVYYFCPGADRPRQIRGCILRYRKV